MKTESVKPRLKQEQRGLVRFWAAPEIAEYEVHLKRLSEDKIRKSPDTQIVKGNQYRIIYKTRLAFFDAPVLIKSFHFPTIRRALRGFFASYAVKELEHATVALERKIPTVPPLFLIQKRSGLKIVTSLIGYRFLEGSSLYAYLSTKDALPYDNRVQFLREAGKFTAFLHDQGGKHRDYHAGNLLILRDGSMVLIDLYPLTFKVRLLERDRIEGLANMIASLIPIVEKAGIDELLDGYREVSRIPLSVAAEDRIMQRCRDIQRRHEMSRSKRCMKDSSQFYQHRSPGLRIAARRDLIPDEISTLLVEFETIYQAQPQNALKNAPESVIFRVDRPGQLPLCIKWYRKRGGLDQIKEWFRGGRVLRAWKSGNGLLARGIPVATPFAMVRTPRGGYLFMEAVGGIELDRLLSEILKLKDRAVLCIKRSLTDRLGYLIGLLHQKGIFHADLKACNIMVEKKDDIHDITSIKLVDYDHVRFSNILSLKYVVKNLAQLNLSVPREISRSFRMRFLQSYIASNPGAPRKKELFRMVWKASEGKPIVYVTDRGDRMESWQS